MNTYNFLYMNLGKWMTQRTTYITNKSKIYLHKSDMVIQQSKDLSFLEQKINSANLEIISFYIMQNNIDKDIKYVFKNIHQNYCQILHGQTIDLIFNHMNKYNHLSIKNVSGDLKSMEKLWLVNPNLRLGINIIKKQNKCIAVTFSSDIKII